MPTELRVNVLEPPGAERLMLLIHGYGADEYDLAGVVPIVDPEGRFIVVCPRGPRRAFFGAGWYDIGPDGGNHDQLLESWLALDDLLTSECENRSLDRTAAIVAGFSQGAAMALSVTLAGQRPRPAGVVAMSGYLPDVDGLTYDWDDAELPPILVQHGIYDEVLPFERGENAAQVLVEHGLDVTFKEYGMGHEISQASAEDARAWLAEVTP